MQIIHRKATFLVLLLTNLQRYVDYIIIYGIVIRLPGNLYSSINNSGFLNLNMTLKTGTKSIYIFLYFKN